ncbi:MAG: hypothetical protein IKI93_07185 [Clostridia bacterium]|nr:hypothetical protein [Clostridia bacterium]
MGTNRRKIAEKKEILRFYTSIMRGEDEHASVSNRLSAAEKLIAQIDAEIPVKSAEAKLDKMLREMKCAVAEGKITALKDEPLPQDEIIPEMMDVPEDEDEDQP